MEHNLKEGATFKIKTHCVALSNTEIYTLIGTVTTLNGNTSKDKEAFRQTETQQCLTRNK